MVRVIGDNVDYRRVLASDAYWQVINCIAVIIQDWEFDAIAGIEARGYYFGCPLAYKYRKPFLPIRKAGRMSPPCITQDGLEIAGESINGAKVLLVDDVLATGETAAAACALVQRVGGEVVGFVCLVERLELEGRKRLSLPDDRIFIVLPRQTIAAVGR